MNEYLINVIGFGIGIILGLIGLCLVYLIYMLLRWGVVHVPEQEAWVVFGRRYHDFRRFLTRGTHWINPFGEFIDGVIPLGPQTAADVCKVRVEGAPADIPWKVTFRLNPELIRTQSRPTMARTLPERANGMVVLYANRYLRRLCAAQEAAFFAHPGGYTRLETALHKKLSKRLKGFGYEIFQVFLQDIQPGARVERALEYRYARQVETDAETLAQRRRHNAMRDLTDDQLARIIELERLHIMEHKNGDVNLFSGVDVPFVSDRSRAEKDGRQPTQRRYPRTRYPGPDVKPPGPFTDLPRAE